MASAQIVNCIVLSTKLFIQGSRASNVTDVCVGIIEHAQVCYIC